MLPIRQTNPINIWAKYCLIWGDTVSQIGQETCIICVQTNARHACPHLLLCEVCELIGISLSDVRLEHWRIMGPGGSCFIPLHYHHIIPANKKWTFPHPSSTPILNLSYQVLCIGILEALSLSISFFQSYPLFLSLHPLPLSYKISGKEKYSGGPDIIKCDSFHWAASIPYVYMHVIFQ